MDLDMELDDRFPKWRQNAYKEYHKYCYNCSNRDDCAKITVRYNKDNYIRKFCCKHFGDFVSNIFIKKFVLKDKEKHPDLFLSKEEEYNKNREHLQKVCDEYDEYCNVCDHLSFCRISITYNRCIHKKNLEEYTNGLRKMALPTKELFQKIEAECLTNTKGM